MKTVEASRNLAHKTARMPSMLRLSLFVLVASLVVTACGSSASISGLRCQQTCLSRVDPLLLLLEADFDDPENEMDGGVLLVRIDDLPPSSLELAELKSAAGGGSNMIRFSVSLPFNNLIDGQQFTVRVRAEHLGRQTSSASLPFTIYL